MVDTGYQMRETRWGIPDTRCRRPDGGYQIPDVRNQIGSKKTSCLREKASLK